MASNFVQIPASASGSGLDEAEVQDLIDTSIAAAAPDSEWTKYTFSYTDFIAGGHGGDSNRELPVVTIPAFNLIEHAIVYISDEFNDLGGDGVTMSLVYNGFDFLSDVGIDGGVQFKRVAQAVLDSSNRRVNDISQDLSVVLNAASGGAHTLSEIVSGEIEVYIKLNSIL